MKNFFFAGNIQNITNMKLLHSRSLLCTNIVYSFMEYLFSDIIYNIFNFYSILFVFNKIINIRLFYHQSDTKSI